jgi:hypothetical protein
LQKVEIGGRLLLKKAKTKKNDTSPDAYFEYLDHDAVTALKEYTSKFKKTNKSNSEDVI